MEGTATTPEYDRIVAVFDDLRSTLGTRPRRIPEHSADARRAVAGVEDPDDARDLAADFDEDDR